ncbi:MAG: cohesin domain-containing protein [Patescibacteria group bacterium]|nr:cohesin domain-containing protein [Patescibacteria group bacterium]
MTDTILKPQAQVGPDLSQTTGDQSKKSQIWSQLLGSKYKFKLILGLGIVVIVLVGLGAVLSLTQKTQENRSSASGVKVLPKLSMMLPGAEKSGDMDSSVAGLQLAKNTSGLIDLYISAGSSPIVATEVFIYYDPAQLEVTPDISANQKQQFGQIADVKNNNGQIRFLLARSPQQKALTVSDSSANFASLSIKMKTDAGDITFTHATVAINDQAQSLINLTGLADNSPFENNRAIAVRKYSAPSAPQPSVSVPTDVPPIQTTAPIGVSCLAAEIRDANSNKLLANSGGDTLYKVKLDSAIVYELTHLVTANGNANYVKNLFVSKTGFGSQPFLLADNNEAVSYRIDPTDYSVGNTLFFFTNINQREDGYILGCKWDNQIAKWVTGKPTEFIAPNSDHNCQNLCEIKLEVVDYEPPALEPEAI